MAGCTGGFPLALTLSHYQMVLGSIPAWTNAGLWRWSYCNPLVVVWRLPLLSHYQRFLGLINSSTNFTVGCESGQVVSGPPGPLPGLHILGTNRDKVSYHRHQHACMWHWHFAYFRCLYCLKAWATKMINFPYLELSWLKEWRKRGEHKIEWNNLFGWR